MVGSDVKAVKYLYEITAAEISRQARCAPVPFDRIYSEAAKKLQVHAKSQAKQNPDSTHPGIYAKIGVCQREFLNRRDTRPFGGAYAIELDLLYADRSFCDKIMQIGTENAQIEFCNDSQHPDFLHFKRVILPNRMNDLGLTEHSIVQSICNSVEQSGKSRKSALITIYYAIRMYSLKRAISQK